MFYSIKESHFNIKYRPSTQCEGMDDFTPNLKKKEKKLFPFVPKIFC